MKILRPPFPLLLSLFVPLSSPFLSAQATTIDVQLDKPAKPISPDLFGVFFEDLSYAADGGLYAELIQNRSFEYNATEQPTWNALSFWTLEQRGGGKGSWAVEDAAPLGPGNPHYVLLDVAAPGDGVGLSNPGFDGIAVKAGETYDLSFFARIYSSRHSGKDKPMPLVARLEGKNGDVLCEAPLQVAGGDWRKVSASLTPARDDDSARFVLLAKAAGGVALDEISLFPRHTFHDRPNGLRADLAQAIADLHPRFMRFPGGCLTHGDGINNSYRWKDSIGPVELRRGQKNIWRYHQSLGLGYYEYFQFCEDIGAKPVPVVAAGVSCQNSDHTSGTGQQCVPLADMPAYIQDILNLIEWANGPATSTWGAKRAAQGHPEPFHLQYLGIGNEDAITPGFKERFKMIYDAVKANHPKITVIGTVGPSPDGTDFTEGWKFAGELKVPVVDEHYYESAQWFLGHFDRYDRYARGGTQVYIGEYAAHDGGRGIRGSDLRAALAEAAYMTQLERNGDVVRMASYAPLLANLRHLSWTPDLIYFDNTQVTRTVSYYVQQLFAMNSGDTYIGTQVDAPASGARPVVSTVRDGKTGDLILKIVNNSDSALPLTIRLDGARGLPAAGIKTVFAGDPGAMNLPDTAHPLVPATSPIAISDSFPCEAPADSLIVIRIKTR